MSCRNGRRATARLVTTAGDWPRLGTAATVPTIDATLVAPNAVHSPDNEALPAGESCSSVSRHAPSPNEESGLRIVNPKQDRATLSGRAAWYPYYAGFSYAFAEAILSGAGLDEGSVVLDPWNGGGTSTAAAYAHSLTSVGFDLNPAMVVVAKARCLSSREKSSLSPLMRDIISKTVDVDNPPADLEPLAVWFAPRSAAAFRGIAAAIRQLLVDPVMPDTRERAAVDALSDLAAFYYTALFRTVRHHMAKFVPTNPTWTKRPTTPQNRLRPNEDTILAAFRADVERMIDGFDDPSCTFHSGHSGGPALNIRVARSEALPLPAGSVDFILTSPPYCTRIDYAIATLPELAVLGLHPDQDVPDLRAKLIGTATVPKDAIVPSEDWGSTCTSFLREMASHRSKASATYYYKNHCAYFDGIFRSMAEIYRVLAADGRAVLVAQYSHYKDIPNDLPGIIGQMAERSGLCVRKRTDFSTGTVMANMHPGSRAYRRRRTAVESVVELRRA